MRTGLYLAAVIAGLGGTRASESIAEREATSAAPGCLVFVVDTSATLRDPRSGRLAPAVFQAVLGTLALSRKNGRSHPRRGGVFSRGFRGRSLRRERSRWVAPS
jgi:hypothetical protein